MLIEQFTIESLNGLVVDRGNRCLARLHAEIDAADPGAQVLPRSRVLCAGLSELGVEVAHALGGADAAEDVAVLAASLSLLTKIDDEWIDALAFHGGADSSRAALRDKTRRYLDVTEASIVAARAVNDEPRAILAATIGRRIRHLASSWSKQDALLELIHQGWATQVDAVVTLTQWPELAPVDEVDRVTRRISGDWLAIIAACGALPSSRPLSLDEVEAIRDAGNFIQRADSLADLEKDQGEGLTSTWAGCWTERILPDGATISDRYGAAREQGLDRLATPSREARATIARRLKRLGGLSPWLGWIHSMLLARYRAHPAHQPISERPRSSPPPRAPSLSVGA